MGTPDYMAPEQIEGQRGDQRTDVYALGTIMYELLTGKLPFTGDSNMVVMAQHLNGTAPRVDKVNPSISPQLAAIVATCLARNPDDRYADMNALMQALEHPENVDLTILDKLRYIFRVFHVFDANAGYPRGFDRCRDYGRANSAGFAFTISPSLDFFEFGKANHEQFHRLDCQHFSAHRTEKY